MGGGYLRYTISWSSRWPSWRCDVAGSGPPAFASRWRPECVCSPVFFPLALLARDLARPGRGASLRRNARLYVAFLATGVAILGSTSFVSTPDGRQPWLAFAENIELHSRIPTINRIGLEMPFLYAPEKDVHTSDVRFGPPPDDWVDRTRELQRDRRGYHLAAAALLLGFAATRLRRCQESGVFVLGLTVVFAFMPLSHYYYALLAVLVLAGEGERFARLALTATLAAVAVTGMPFLFSGQPDLLFALFSLEILALLVALIWWLPRSAPTNT